MTSDMAAQHDANATLVEQRIEFGDLPQFPRPLDHVAFVPRKRADVVQEELRTAGYRIDRAKRGLRRTMIEFSRHDAADLDTADTRTREIVTILAPHGGEYDGWSAFLVTEPPSATEDR